MKNRFYLFFAMSIILSACNSASEDKSSDQKYTLQNEVHKKFMAVKVIKVYSENAIDAFGDPLVEDRWYGVSNLTKSFFPISWTDGTLSFNFDARHHLFYPNLKIELEKARIVASNSSCMGAPVDVEVLLLGFKNLVFMNSMESDGSIRVKVI